MDRISVNLLILLIAFSLKSCTHDANEKQTKLASNHESKNACNDLSKKEIYEKSTSCVNKILKNNQDYKMKYQLCGDTIWKVKLIPITIQFGGVIDLEIKTDNCEVKILKIGK